MSHPNKISTSGQSGPWDGLRLNQSETASLYGLKDAKSIRNWERKRGFPRPVRRNGPKVEYDVGDLAKFSERTKTPICLDSARLYRIPSTLLSRFYHPSCGPVDANGNVTERSSVVRARIIDEISGVCSGRYHAVPPMLQRGLDGLLREGNEVLVDVLAGILSEGCRRRNARTVRTGK